MAIPDGGESIPDGIWVASSGVGFFWFLLSFLILIPSGVNLMPDGVQLLVLSMYLVGLSLKFSIRVEPIGVEVVSNWVFNVLDGFEPPESLGLDALIPSGVTFILDGVSFILDGGRSTPSSAHVHQGGEEI